MKKFLPLLLAVINFISPLKAADQSIQSTINRMANELTATYRSKSPNAKRARLAILDLQASEDLNKQRIGPALTDMITNEFVNNSDFIVLERELFGKIMEEHQLLANFGDVSNAIKVGKVLGAEVVLLGSVTQFKSDLRINLRLVNTETTEILSTTSGMVAITEFSKENPLTPGFVPITQKIGLFVVYEYRFPGKAHILITTSEGGRVTEINLSNFSLGYTGIGFRYFPITNYFIEGSYLKLSNYNNSGVSRSIAGGSWTGASQFKGSSFRLELGARKNIYENLSFSSSLGVAFQKLNLGTGAGFANGNPNISQTVSYLGIGANYNIQHRLVIGLQIRGDLGKMEAKETVSDKIVYTASPLVISPQLTFYF
jgi:curli biogenesis system outer membrane secretion channel CsgG